MNTFQTLDKEVKELLENYRYKKTSVYEPCTPNNFKECLIGLREELGLLNINYIFNPYLDIMEDKLSTEGLIALINAVYTVLYHYKNIDEKVDMLSEQNHILEHNNKQFNVTVKMLKEKINEEKNEARACVVATQRVSDQSDKIVAQLNDSRSQLTRVKKQKEAQEKNLKNEITRLRLENEKLRDQLRGKHGTYVSCSEICDSTLRQLREREKKHQAMVHQLQLNNQELLHEVLKMKEQLLTGAISEITLNKPQK